MIVISVSITSMVIFACSSSPAADDCCFGGGGRGWGAAWMGVVAVMVVGTAVVVAEAVVVTAAAVLELADWIGACFEKIIFLCTRLPSLPLIANTYVRSLL